MERTGGLRVIAHLDLDCFYAQVEQRRLNISADIPLVVCQWNGIIAVNYAARRYGIQRGFSLSEAKRRCPHVYLAHVGLIHVEPNENPSQVVPDQTKHKASLTRYREASQEVLRVIRKFHDKHHERASIDEVYIELTSSVCELLHNIFISLQPLKNTHPFSEIFHKLEAKSLHQNFPNEQPCLSLLSFHQPFIESGNFSFQYTQVEHILHLLRLLYHQSCTPCQETQLDVKGDNVLHDVCRNIFDESLGLLREIAKTSLRLKKVLNVVDPLKNTTVPVEFTTLCVQDFLMTLGSVIVYRTREAIQQTTGFTVSIGIARTKFFAKWLSSKYKPDTQTILLHSDIEKLLDKIPLLEANGLRGKTGNLVASLLPDVQYLSDISRHYTLRSLQDTLSPHGFDSEFAHRLHTLSRGEMDDPVRSVTQVKSMMSCKTFKPVKCLEDMTIYVRLICKDLSERLDTEYRLTGRTPKNFVIHQSGGVSTASRTRSISCFCNVKDQQGTEKMLIEKMMFVLSSRFTSEELFPCNRLGLCAHLHKTKVLQAYNVFERLQAIKNTTIPLTISDFDSIVKRQFNPPYTLQPIKPKVLSRWCKKKKSFGSLKACSRCNHPEIRISS